MNILIFLASILFSNSSFATTCVYVLNQENYADSAAGVLTVGITNYYCDDLMIGSDKVTVCKNGQTKSGYDLIVSFDGAEATFEVRDGLFNFTPPICSGQATVAQPVTGISFLEGTILSLGGESDSYYLNHPILGTIYLSHRNGQTHVYDAIRAYNGYDVYLAGTWDEGEDGLVFIVDRIDRK